MEKFEVRLLTSVNGVPFGTKREEVRRAFGPEYEAIRKWEDKPPVDCYELFEASYIIDLKRYTDLTSVRWHGMKK